MVTYASKPLTLEEVRQLSVLTPRVARLRQRLLEAPLMVDSSRSRLLTETWKEAEGQHITMCKAKAIQKILGEIPIFIREDELIVGSQSKYVRGTHPAIEWGSHALLEELSGGGKVATQGEVALADMSEEDRGINLDCARYWEHRSMGYRMEQRWRDLWGNFIFDCEDVALFKNVYRVGPGVKTYDFGKLFRVGLKGVIEEAEAHLRTITPRNEEEVNRWYFLQSAILSCRAAIHFAHRHAELARKMAALERNVQRRRELERIAQVCQRVPEHPPANFWEALQSFWFVLLVSRLETVGPAETPGRFDQYMFPLYRGDVEGGTLTHNQAAELLACLWTKMAELVTYYDPFTRALSQGSEFINLTLGGVTPDGKDASNELSLLVLEVEKAVRYPTPHISLRCHDQMSQDLLIQALECNKAVGGGIPAFFNDTPAILRMCEKGVPIAESRNWVPMGCVGSKIDGSGSSEQFPWVNLGKCLELVLHNGADPRTGKKVGLETGDPRKFKTYQEFEEAVRQQIERAMRWGMEAGNVCVQLRLEHYRMPFTSALANDCIQKGKDVFEGGYRYNSLHCKVLPVGHATLADSLTAVRRLVYEDKVISLDLLTRALDANFEGPEFQEVRHKLLKAPKYGNDDDYADEQMVKVYAWTEAVAFSHNDIWGNHWNISRQGNASHYTCGVPTGATPDGRKAWEPFADGSLSPMRGMDLKGPTAVFNSASKPDYLRSDGTVLNQKVHPTVLRGRDQYSKLLALVQGYFSRGGYQVQFNMLSPQMLMEAKRNPEQYRDLVVRVGGYSAYFVELAPEVQDEIIARTSQEVC